MNLFSDKKGRIAAIYTCFNRKEKTLGALEHLFRSYKSYGTSKFSLDVYLMNDGCTDGTPEAVKEHFPEVIVLEGTGSLFWAEGMRLAWEEAIKENFDGYLLLNDDTMVYKNLFEEIERAHRFSVDNFGKDGVYVGVTKDNDTNLMTYSGSLITNKWLYTQKRLQPNGTPQPCDMGNANILFVPASVVEKIGVMAKGYTHGKGDYDYTLSASRNNIPVLITANFCGDCAFDHKDYYEGFSKKSLKERKEYVYHPLGLDTKSHLKFMTKFFPLRAPIVYLFTWFKIYFPNIYLKYFLNYRST